MIRKRAPRSWLAGCRHPCRCYERKAEHFLVFTCTLICYRMLMPTRDDKAQVFAAP